MRIKGGRKQTRLLDGETVDDYYERFLELDKTIKGLTAQKTKMSTNLKAYAVEAGVEDEKGHRWVETSAGTFKRERRAAVFLQEAVAREWLRKKGREKECLKRVVTTEFDVAAFNAVLFETKTPASVAEKFYETTETFALIPSKSGRPADDPLE